VFTSVEYPPSLLQLGRRVTHFCVFCLILWN